MAAHPHALIRCLCLVGLGGMAWANAAWPAGLPSAIQMCHLVLTHGCCGLRVGGIHLCVQLHLRPVACATQQRLGWVARPRHMQAQLCGSTEAGSLQTSALQCSGRTWLCAVVAPLLLHKVCCVGLQRAVLKAFSGFHHRLESFLLGGQAGWSSRVRQPLSPMPKPQDGRLAPTDPTTPYNPQSATPYQLTSMKHREGDRSGELGIMGGRRPSSRGSVRRLGCRPAATSCTALATGWMSSSARVRRPWLSGCTLQHNGAAHVYGVRKRKGRTQFGRCTPVCVQAGFACITHQATTYSTLPQAHQS